MEDLLADVITDDVEMEESPDQASFSHDEMVPWSCDAYSALLISPEYRQFKEQCRYLKEKYQEFLAAGHDMSTYKPWLRRWEKFEQLIIGPLEAKWQELQAREARWKKLGL